MQFEKLLQQSLLWRGFYFLSLLFVNIVVSRYLQADGSGYMYFITTIFSLILLVASLNLETGFTFYASSQTIQSHKLAFLGIVWSLVTTLLVIPVLKAGFAYKGIAGEDTGRFIVYGILYIGGIILSTYFCVLYYAQKDFLTPNVCLGALNFLLVGLVLWEGKQQASTSSVTYSYFVFFTLQGIVLALLYFIQHRRIAAILLPDWREMRLLLRYSLLALLTNVIFFFVYRVDYWFVYQYRTAAELGNYIQASKLGQMLLVIPQVMASAVLPQTASNTLTEEVRRSLVIIFRLLIQFFLFLAVIVAVVGKWVFPLILGNTFNQVYIPFLILLPGVLSLSILSLLSAYFGGKGRMKINLAGACIALLIAIAGDIMLVPLYGIPAAAFISTVAYTANMFFSLWHFKKSYAFTIKEMITFSRADWQWVIKVAFNK